MSKRSLMPSFRFKSSINPDMIVIIPSPPIWISTRITACPNVLHADAVGSVTSPVTHVEVVAVNRASRYGTATPSAALIGSIKRTLPSKIVTRKLNRMICVVDSINFLFIFIIPLSCWIDHLPF